jgi:hypothetical protein
MRKQKAPLRDFFSEYNHTKIRSTVLSAMFALLLSVSFVMVNQGVNTQGLLASVSSIANEKHYDADVILETQSGWMIDIVFGSLARSVDSLTFTLLSDPEKFTALATWDGRVQIVNQDGGVYMVTMSLSGEDIYPGTKVLTLRAMMDPSVNIALVDTTFESAGLKYNLTSKWK